MPYQNQLLINGRIPSLDGYRAISILFVILSHLALNTKLPYPLNDLLRTWNFGQLGVRIFFVISGFIITYLLLTEKQRYGRVRLKAFYFRRLLRIFPGFYTFFFFVLAFNYFDNLKIPYQNFLSSGLFFQNFTPWPTVWLVGHTWSLAVEEQFYLVWPLVLFFTKNVANRQFWIIGLFGISLAGLISRGFHYVYADVSVYMLAPFLMHADFLFAGCFLAYLVFYHNARVSDFYQKVAPFYLYLAIISVLLISYWSTTLAFKPYLLPVSGIFIISGIGFAFLYFIFRRENAGFKILNHALVVSIGKISFSLYIWQQLFLSDMEYWFALFPQNLVLVFLAGNLSYRFIEVPFLKFRHKYKFE